MIFLASRAIIRQYQRILKRFVILLVATVVPVLAQGPEAPVVREDPLLDYNPANDFFERGKNLYDAAAATEDPELRRDQYDLAARLFSSYLADYPNHENSEKAWWYLGNSYYQAGSIEDARRAFATLINRYNKGAWVAAAAYTLAADHYNHEDYAMAAPLFERYAKNIDKPEEVSRGWYYAGSCYRLLGRDHQALNSMNKVVEDPEGKAFTDLAELAIAHVSVKIGRLDEAFKIFQKLIGKDGVTSQLRSEAMLHAALVARKLEKEEVANGYLNQLLADENAKEYWTDAEVALMSSYFTREQYAKVIELYRNSKLVVTGKQAASRLMTVGRSLIRLEQHKEALAIFRQIERQVQPDSKIAFNASFYRLLCFYQVEGRHVAEQVDAFLQLYQAAHPHDYRIHTALMMKAETLYADKRVAEAAQVYNQVEATVVSEQNRPGLYYQRGWCLAEAGDQQGAIRSLTLFINGYPEDERLASALAKRARVQQDSGKAARAIADYDRLIKLGKPQDLLSYAWLESARLKRSEGQIDDMVARYRGLIDGIEKLSDELKAEAHYWIGWGLVKTNQAKESVEHLEQARALRGDLYDKHSGILLALGYYAAQNADQLALEVDLAIKESYADELPDQALQWVGMQSFNGGKFQRAATFLALIAKPDEPRATPKEVWRYLGKSQIEVGNAEAALVAVDHVLEVENNMAWKADGLLDKARALFLLERYDESRKAADEALGLQPQGRTRSSLRLLVGDLEMKAGDPSKASAQYLIVVNFMDDDQLKPLALSKVVAAFDAQGDAAQAAKYRQQLVSEFPTWKAP